VKPAFGSGCGQLGVSASNHLALSTPKLLHLGCGFPIFWLRRLIFPPSGGPPPRPIIPRSGIRSIWSKFYLFYISLGGDSCFYVRFFPGAYFFFHPSFRFSPASGVWCLKLLLFSLPPKKFSHSTQKLLHLCRLIFPPSISTWFLSFLPECG
jgi:hypothetical protein